VRREQDDDRFGHHPGRAGDRDDDRDRDEHPHDLDDQHRDHDGDEEHRKRRHRILTGRPLPGRPGRRIHSAVVARTHPGDSGAIKPAYLIAGDDEGKIDAALSRLRARAEREAGAIESFTAGTGGAPDVDDLLAAIPAMSLIGSRRYLLADGVERWTGKQSSRVIAALGELPPELTLVLVARELSPKAAAPKGLAEAVTAAGGEVLAYSAPKARDLPARLVDEAKRRGLRLDRAAARLLVERMGESTLRLGHELDRLALWAGDGGEVRAADLEAMVADTSEEAAWALSDAILARDPAGALAAAERLIDQGEAVTALVYRAARRLRDATIAIARLEDGVPERQVAQGLRMHPYAARMLIRRLRGTSAAAVRFATCSIADLEWWTRGGSEYPDDVALTLAVWRAAGAGAGAG
jgi:DNA polymerase-3 subunit delta